MDQCSGFSIVERRAFWRMAVELQRESGMTGAEFCRREQLHAKTFWKWRQRLALAAGGDGVGTGGTAEAVGANWGRRIAPASGNADAVNPLFLPLQIQTESMEPPVGHGSGADRVPGVDGVDCGGVVGCGYAVEIILRGQRRIMLRDDGRVPACLGEVVRILESVECSAVATVAAGSSAADVARVAGVMGVHRHKECR